MTTTGTILDIRNLTVRIEMQGGALTAVENASLSITRGTVCGLAGESGSGKTMLALSIMRLLPHHARIASGSIRFAEKELTTLDERAMQDMRGNRFAMVFQEPSTAFNPVMTVGTQIVEAILAHRRVSARAAREDALAHLEKVRIRDPKRVFHDYPHQLSGGMKQRAMIAMALINTPDLLILDEPTTALDVTVQGEIIALLKDLIRTEHISALFISHDFGVIASMCDTVAIIRAGKIVECNSVEEILRSPQTAYTRILLDTVRKLA